MTSKYNGSSPVPSTWRSYFDRKKRAVKSNDAEVLVQVSI